MEDSSNLAKHIETHGMQLYGRNIDKGLIRLFWIHYPQSWAKLKERIVHLEQNPAQRPSNAQPVQSSVEPQRAGARERRADLPDLHGHMHAVRLRFGLRPQVPPRVHPALEP